MAAITLEPARFGMSGPASYSGMRADCDLRDVQALDAPQYIARGSVLCSDKPHDGVFYASTTDLMCDRIKLDAQ